MPHANTTDRISEFTTFPQFALRCATIFILDSYVVEGGPFGIQIPRQMRRKVGRAIDPSRRVLERLKGMSPKQQLAWAEKAAARLFNAQLQQYEDKVAEYAGIRSNCEKILEQAKAWKSPTKLHRRLKQEMIKQLQEYIEEIGKDLEKPVRIPAAKFLADEKKRRKDTVDFWSKLVKTDEETRKKTNAWLDSLTKSLKPFK